MRLLTLVVLGSLAGNVYSQLVGGVDITHLPVCAVSLLDTLYFYFQLKILSKDALRTTLPPPLDVL